MDANEINELDERACTAESERDAALATIDKVHAIADEWARDRDVCLAWIADPSKHVDPGHPMRLSGVADVLNQHAVLIRAATPDPEGGE